LLLQQLDALEAEEKQLTSQLEGITAQLNQVQSQNSALAAQPPDDELEVNASDTPTMIAALSHVHKCAATGSLAYDAVVRCNASRFCGSGSTFYKTCSCQHALYANKGSLTDQSSRFLIMTR
jgi:hypothetical protein